MPNVPIIRTSERRSVKRCPQQWWWAWRMGLKPLGAISPALWFGTGVHIALAKWYCGPGLKRGPEPAETFKLWADGEVKFIKTSNKFGNGAQALIEEKLVPAVELGTVLLQEYLKEYGRDDSWHVIEPERSGQVDIMYPDFPEEQLAIYAFTYDLVYRDLEDDRIWLGEHKTAKAITTDHLPLDDQAGSYWMVAASHLRKEGLIGPKEKLRGVMYNFLRKSLPDDRPCNAEGYYCNKPTKADYAVAIRDDGYDEDHNVALSKMKVEELQALAEQRGLKVFGEVSKLQPKPLFQREPVTRTAAERATQLRRIQNEAIFMDALRHKDLPLFKNPTQDCRWGCDFYHMCMLDEGGSDADEYRRDMYRQQDPYADHRKSTEE